MTESFYSHIKYMFFRIIQKYTNIYKGKSKKLAVAIVTKGEGQQKKVL